MGYYLLDNPTARIKWTAGNFTKVAVVIHCTAGLDIADSVRAAGGRWAGVDRSAEQTAKWCAGSTTSSSWHSGSDWDSYLDLLPSGYIAWHVHKYNTPTVGHEISKRDMTWGDEHEGWVGPTLHNAAIKVAQHCKKHHIPIRYIGKGQVDYAKRTNDPADGGISEHRVLDPARRSDPGADFPWSRFLGLVKIYAGGTPPKEEDMPITDAEVQRIAEAVWKRTFRTYRPGSEPTTVSAELYVASRDAAIARALAETAARGVTLTEAQVDELVADFTDSLADGVDIDVDITAQARP